MTMECSCIQVFGRPSTLLDRRNPGLQRRPTGERATQVRGETVIAQGLSAALRPTQLAVVDVIDSAVDAGGGAARHTRAWSVGAPTVVADCRLLSFVPLPCQMQGSATVNERVSRSSSQQPSQVSKPQLSDTIPPPLPKAVVALWQGRRRHNHWNQRREIRRRAIEVSQIHAPHQPCDYNSTKAAASRSGRPQLAAPLAPTAVSTAVHRG